MAGTPLKPDAGRRTAILEAALTLIGEHGCDGLSHRKIARRAEVPLGSTTYYFATRDALLLEAFRLYMQRFDARLDRCRDLALADHPADGLEAVAAFLVRLVEDELQDRRLLRAEGELILYASGHAELAAEVRAWQRRLQDGLALALAQAGIGEAGDAASALMRLTRGVEMDAMVRPEVNLAVFGAQIERLLAGYGAG